MKLNHQNGWNLVSLLFFFTFFNSFGKEFSMSICQCLHIRVKLDVFRTSQSLSQQMRIRVCLFFFLKKNVWIRLLYRRIRKDQPLSSREITITQEAIIWAREFDSLKTLFTHQKQKEFKTQKVSSLSKVKNHPMNWIGFLVWDRFRVWTFKNKYYFLSQFTIIIGL